MSDGSFSSAPGCLSGPAQVQLNKTWPKNWARVTEVGYAQKPRENSINLDSGVCPILSE